MALTKKRIEALAISGLPLCGEDVARSNRKLTAITLRHVWPENVDARTWDGVRRAYARYARDLANATGKRIDVYSYHGDQIDQISPDL